MLTLLLSLGGGLVGLGRESVTSGGEAGADTGVGVLCDLLVALLLRGGSGGVDRLAHVVAAHETRNRLVRRRGESGNEG